MTVGRALRFLASAAFAGTITACGADSARTGRDVPDELDHSGLGAQPLEGATLYADSSLGLAGNLAVLEDKLVVLDAYGDSAIHVLRRADGELLHRFGRRGQGPGEFDGPRSADPVPGRNDAFWVFDAALRRLTLVELTSGNGVATVDRDVFVNLDANTTLLDPVLVDNGFVSAGFFSGGRLGRFDANGELIETVGEIPETTVGDFPAVVRQQAYQPKLRPNPSRTMLVLATRHSDQLEIYQMDGTPVRRVYGPFRFEPTSFDMGQRGEWIGMIPEPDLRFGYVGVAATDDRIYALFSGRTNGAFEREAPYAEYVHVYDWDGEFHGVLKLDRASLGIAVDPQGRELYLTTEDPEPAVRVYPLPEREWL